MILIIFSFNNLLNIVITLSNTEGTQKVSGIRNFPYLKGGFSRQNGGEIRD